MIDIGIATSVAKEQNYSWQKTLDLANSYHLNSIQLYLPENCQIPKPGNLSNFQNIYLHLPNSFNPNSDHNVNAMIKFQDKFNSNKLILHQNEENSKSDTLNMLKIINANGFAIGIENEGKTHIESFKTLITLLNENRINCFIVIDVHRFYNNFYKKYSQEIITGMIFQILTLCAESDLKIVLHLIDSTSFSSSRKFWTPVFEGVTPYLRIFNYIFNRKINIESIILEYESEENILPSLNNLINSFNKLDGI